MRSRVYQVSISSRRSRHVRDRRDEIDTWSTRERIVFYGAALLIVTAIGVYFWRGVPGYELLGFLGVLGGSGYAMFRIWRGRHSYS